MKGDFTRFTHKPSRQYTRVLRQQGRVDLDADWNEAMDIQAHERRVRTRDIVGMHGAPRDDAGFGVTFGLNGASPDLRLSRGRLYVDGLLATLEEDTWYTKQGEGRWSPPDLAPEDTERHVVYAEVWERHVTADVDEGLLEPALDGLDTATRTQTVAQVRWMKAPKDHLCPDEPEAWKLLTAEPAVGLSSRGTPPDEVTSPCEVQPRRGYHGLENRLYRVEVHQPGWPYPLPQDVALGEDEKGPASRDAAEPDLFEAAGIGGRPWQVGDAVELFGAGGASVLTYIKKVEQDGRLRMEEEVAKSVDMIRLVATFKWSRDNGSVVFPVTSHLPGSGLERSVQVAGFGRDRVLGLRPGDWVELVTDTTELERRPGAFARVVKVHEGDMRVDLDRPVACPDPSAKPSLHPRLRRWDHLHAPRAVTVGATGDTPEYLHLEDGVEVRFHVKDSPSGSEDPPKRRDLRTGDWWAFTARASGVPGDHGTVEPLEDAPPRGKVHHAKLAIVEWRADAAVPQGWDPVVRDCRRIFAPLTELDTPCATTSVGDGKRSIGHFIHDDGHRHGIQDAVDSIGPGVVHILPGTYPLDEPLRLHGGVTLEGCGDASVLVAPAGQPAVWVEGSGAVVEDVAVAALRVEAASVHGAIRFEQAGRVRVEACTVEAADQPGIVARDASRVHVAGNTVTATPAVHLQADIARVEGNRLRGSVVVSDGSDRVAVLDNHVHKASGHGIRVGGSAPALGSGGASPTAGPPLRVRVERNRIHRATGCAIHALHPGTEAQDLVVRGNLIRQCRTDPDGDEATVHIRGWTRVVVDGNHVTDNGRTRPDDPAPGVRLEGCRDVDAWGNRIAKNGGIGAAAGLEVTGCATAHVHDNHLHGWGTVWGLAGPSRVAVRLKGHGIRLHGNRVRGGCIQVCEGSDGVHVEENHVLDGHGPGIHVGGAPAPQGWVGKGPWPAIVLRGNHVRRVRGNGIQSVTPTVGLRIEGNHVEGSVREEHGLPPAAILVLEAEGLKLRGNRIHGNGSGLGSPGRAGVRLVACHDVHAGENHVMDGAVAWWATGASIDMLGDHLEAATALRVRATDVRVTGAHLVGEVRLADGCLRPRIEDNDLHGALRLGGALDAHPGHAVGIHDALVADNRIHGAEGPGIETVRAGKDAPVGGVHGLLLRGNEVTECAGDAVVLRGVAGVRVEGNHIHRNGPGLALLARDCIGVVLEGNRVHDNEPGNRGAGVVLRSCIPASKGQHDRGPAVRVHGNTVVSQRGPALVATGVGGAAVQDNHLTSLAPLEKLSGEWSVVPLGSCVDVWFPDNDPLRGLWLPHAGLPGHDVQVQHRLDHNLVRGGSAAFAAAPLGSTLAHGRVVVQGNQVTQHGAAGSGDATVAVMAGADAAVQDNQVRTAAPGGFVRSAVLVHAPDTRITGNAVEELPWGASWSVFAMAHRAVVLSNQTTHCIHPGRVMLSTDDSVLANHVLVTARCPASSTAEGSMPKPEIDAQAGLEARLRNGWARVAGDAYVTARGQAARVAAVLGRLDGMGHGLPDDEDDALRPRLAAEHEAVLDLAKALRVTVARNGWMVRASVSEPARWAVVGRVLLEVPVKGDVRIRLVQARLQARSGHGGMSYHDTGFEATLDRHGDFRMHPGADPGTYELQLRNDDGRVLHTTQVGLSPGAGRRDVVEIVVRRP